MWSDLRPARWYDAIPDLKFALALIRVMPLVQQATLEHQLSNFLTHRGLPSYEGFLPHMRRQEDAVPCLSETLMRLKRAPQSLQLQAGQFLIQQCRHLSLIEDAEAS